jgi:hypothetical protein
MSQPVRSSALNFSSPWLVETPESFVILDAADAWVFLSPAAPIFIWGICTHRWLLLHSCNMCYMPCSRRNNNSPGTGSRSVGRDNLCMSSVAFLGRMDRTMTPQRLTGTDVGVTKDGKLTVLYVFIDPPSQK